MKIKKKEFCLRRVSGEEITTCWKSRAGLITCNSDGEGKIQDFHDLQTETM